MAVCTNYLKNLHLKRKVWQLNIRRISRELYAANDDPYLNTKIHEKRLRPRFDSLFSSGGLQTAISPTVHLYPPCIGDGGDLLSTLPALINFRQPCGCDEAVWTGLVSICEKRFYPAPKIDGKQFSSKCYTSGRANFPL
jgi:hypothetical protein